MYDENEKHQAYVFSYQFDEVGTYLAFWALLEWKVTAKPWAHEYISVDGERVIPSRVASLKMNVHGESTKYIPTGVKTEYKPIQTHEHTHTHKWNANEMPTKRKIVTIR